MMWVTAMVAAVAAALPGASIPEQARADVTISGVGHFVYDEDGVRGHRIWFGVQAAARRDGSVGGEFLYRHELADGTLLAQGRADVTCLRVTGKVALFTAIVPDGVGDVPHHGFYVKVIDGGAAGRDRISDAQAQGGSEPPPTSCVDPADHQRPTYPVLRGGYTVHGAR